MRIHNDTEGMILISPGMKGKVIMRSENLLARAVRKAGLPITAGPWVLVEFENGFRMVVDSLRLKGTGPQHLLTGGKPDLDLRAFVTQKWPEEGFWCRQ